MNPDIQPPAATSPAIPWMGWVGGGARFVMAFVASWLVSTGIADPSLKEAIITGGAGILMGGVALGWSFVQKWLAQKALNVALRTPPDVPAAEAARLTKLAP